MLDDKQAAEARVGSMLKGKWRLERLLGVGGMAAVYEATHRIGRRDAIKILHPAVARSRELRERFEQEAHAVNRFSHPGAVEVRDIDVTDEGEPFLVMELLEGQSLSRRVGPKAEIDLDELLGYVDELLDVLAAAHAEGIIHRDIKPDNLFLQAQGPLKVLDFGIARMREGASKSSLTQIGTRLGTVPYMPPEQVRGLPIDARADLFAVGAMMFRLIAKRRVHEAPTEAEMVAKMTMDPAVPLSFAAEQTPMEVCMVVDRALAFDPARRYPDAKTMQADVQAARRGREPPFAAQMIATSGQPNEGMTRDVVSSLFAPTSASAAMTGAASSTATPTSSAEPTAATSVGSAASSIGDLPTAAATPAASAQSPSLAEMATEAPASHPTRLSSGATGPSPTMISDGAPSPPSQVPSDGTPMVAIVDAAPASTVPGSPAETGSSSHPRHGMPPSGEVPGQATAAAAAPGESRHRGGTLQLPLLLAALGGVLFLAVLAGGGAWWALARSSDESAPTEETPVGMAGGAPAGSKGLAEAEGEPLRADVEPPSAPAPPTGQPLSPTRPASDPVSPAEPSSPAPATTVPGAAPSRTTVPLGDPKGRASDEDEDHGKGKGKGKDDKGHGKKKGKKK